MEYKAGELARSKAGHDKDEIYVVLGLADDGMVAVANGTNRTVGKPKLKNPVHLQIIHRMVDGALTDENIRRFLESYGGDN